MLIIDKLKKRGKGIRSWLKTNHPKVFKEQKHLDEGSIERAYWHYGYLVALRDMTNLIKKMN